MFARRLLVIGGVCLAAAFTPFTASAHLNVDDDGTHRSAETALLITDPGLSQVVYHEAGLDSQTLWVTFSGAAGQSVYLQLGLPYLERLAKYRPQLIILGPGLPMAEAPVDVPEGLGARVIATDTGEPEFFEEIFTGTEDWVLHEEDFVLPETGKYYVVIQPTEAVEAKYWLAIGRREAYGLDDILDLPEVIRFVREFHEAADEPLPLLPRVLTFAGNLLRFVTRFFWFLFL